MSIARAVREARREKKMTMKEMVDALIDAGYPISYNSYANFETEQETAVKPNKLLIKKIMEVLEIKWASGLISHSEWSSLPEKPLRNGPHKQLARPRKTLNEISKALNRLHHEDPENMGFCEGCEMLWPCTTEVEITSKLFY